MQTRTHTTRVLRPDKKCLYQQIIVLHQNQALIQLKKQTQNTKRNTTSTSDWDKENMHDQVRTVDITSRHRSTARSTKPLKIEIKN